MKKRHLKTPCGKAAGSLNARNIFHYIHSLSPRQDHGEYARYPFIFFLISLFIFALDQFTKYFIKTHVGPFDVVRVTSFFNIVYVLNTGSAFGMFKSLGNLFFIIIALSAMALLIFLIIKDSRNRLSFALILGGAAGNLADRVLLGHVIDFLDFYVGSHHWPSFNVADSSLTIGISLLLIKTVFEKKTF